MEYKWTTKETNKTTINITTVRVSKKKDQLKDKISKENQINNGTLHTIWDKQTSKKIKNDKVKEIPNKKHDTKHAPRFPIKRDKNPKSKKLINGK